jgi:hypothetical protein
MIGGFREWGVMLIAAVISAIVFSAGGAPAAVKGAAARAPDKGEESRPVPQRKKASDDLETARASLVKATNDYKASLEKLVEIYKRAVDENTELLATRKQLFEQGILSRRELDETERKVVEAQANLAAANKQIGETDNMLAEAAAIEAPGKVSIPAGKFITTAAYMRFNGSAGWKLQDAAKVSAFFSDKFGRSLPISAYGQSGVHNSLGFDHRNSVDVALHPDSAEGQALMTHLRAAGIPFIAFRRAVPGSATGAHIHIGYPSHRK